MGNKTIPAQPYEREPAAWTDAAEPIPVTVKIDWNPWSAPVWADGHADAWTDRIVRMRWEQHGRRHVEWFRAERVTRRTGQTE